MFGEILSALFYFQKETLYAFFCDTSLSGDMLAGAFYHVPLQESKSLFDVFLKSSVKNASQTHEKFFNDVKLVFLTIGSGCTVQDNSILHDPRRNHSVVSHATSTALLFPLCSARILFGVSFCRFGKSWNVDSVWRILTSSARPHEALASGQVVGETAASIDCISTVDVRLKWQKITF